MLIVRKCFRGGDSYAKTHPNIPLNPNFSKPKSRRFRHESDHAEGLFRNN
jgi:hypothetical protein